MQAPESVGEVDCALQHDHILQMHPIVLYETSMECPRSAKRQQSDRSRVVSSAAQQPPALPPGLPRFDGRGATKRTIQRVRLRRRWAAPATHCDARAASSSGASETCRT